jgi:mannose-1-phosphate guanylyltransferase
VWNGDILADVDPRALVDSVSSEDDAALAVRPCARGEGNVGVDVEARIVRLRRESVASEAHGGEFLGIHVLGERILRRLPERGCLVGDVYIPAMRGGARLRAVAHAPPFFDIGSPRGYLDANLAWLRSRGLSHWIGEGACVADGIALELAVVGAGAAVDGSGALERCVVWPGAHARAPLADAVAAVMGVLDVNGSTPPG